MNQPSMQVEKVTDRRFADKHKPMGVQKSDPSAELRRLASKPVTNSSK